MKIIFFGLGSIGQRHLRLINEMYDFDVYAFKSQVVRSNERDYGFVHVQNKICHHVYDWQQIDKLKPDVAFITNPTHLHIETAIKCLEHGINKIFLEKPIDCKTDGLDRLLDLARGNHSVVYVAYPLRHVKEFNRIKKDIDSDIYLSCKSDLAKWRTYQTYSALAKTGGGAILELSHEIDLAEFLMGSIVDIKGKCGKVKDSATDAEDFCVINIEHVGGKHSNIVLDIADKEREERFLIYDNGRSRFDYKADDDTFKNQLKYFFDNIDNPKLINNIFDASKTFRKIIEFRQKEGINNQ